MRFLDCVERFAPTWVVWENVPGVLSIDGGRAFGAFLGGLAKRGYGFAYRVLDAQYFDLAQRRERVFVVGCSGGRWQRAAAVLFDAPRLRWNTPPRRETGKRVAGTVGARTKAGGGFGTDFECDGGLAAIYQDSEFGVKAYETAGSQRAGRRSDHQMLVEPVAHSLTAEGHDASEDGAGRGVPLVSQCISTRNERYDAETQDFIPVFQEVGRPERVQTESAHAFGVRRLTVEEVETLFGFPRGYTLIPYRGKPACDGPRYRALGNSIAVPLLTWLGQRIELVAGLKP